MPTIATLRTGLWGTSLGGMNVLRVASARRDVAVAIVQCPMVHGPAAARRLGLASALRLSPFIVEDALRVLFHRHRRYVPIVGPPGGTAVVTIAGAEEGWNSTVPPGGHFDNRVAAAAPGLVWTSALRAVRTIAAPLLVCVCDRETLIDPKYVELIARRAPRGVARHYDSDHFEIYHQALADQTAFLQKHLDVRA